MRKILKNSIFVKTLVLSLYIFFVLFTYLYLEVTDYAAKTFLLAFLLTALIAPFMYLLIRKSSRTELVPAEQPSRKVFWICFLAILAVECVWYIGFRPGLFSRDSLDQYLEAASGSYTDWHPAWHTIVTFTIPLKLTGQTGAIVLLQVLYFSLAIGYMGYVIYKRGGLWPTVLSIGYIGLNPYVSRVLMYPWKDVAFGVTGIVALTMTVEIICDQEKRNKRWFLILLGVAAANATIFRHNGILFTAPLTIIALFFLPKKRLLYLLLPCVLTFALIKVPVYSLLGVQSPGRRVTETTDLPMTVISNVVKEDPESMSESLSAFVYSIAPEEQWETGEVGNFNVVKWAGINAEPIENAGAGRIVRWMFECFRKSPKASFKALFALTDVVYGFETGTEGNVISDRVSDDYGMAYSGIPAIGGLLNDYQDFVDQSIFRYLRTYGIALLAILMLALAKLKASSWQSWKRILLAVPLFAYDFGTMLLLTGPDSRFFWITFLAAPLLIVFLLSKDADTLT